MELEVLKPGKQEGPQTGGLGAQPIFLTATGSAGSTPFLRPHGHPAALATRVHVPMAVSNLCQARTISGPVSVSAFVPFSPRPPLFLRNVWLKNSSLVPAGLRGKGLWPNVSWRIAGAGPPESGGAGGHGYCSQEPVHAWGRDNQKEMETWGGARDREREAQRQRDTQAQRDQDQKGKCYGRYQRVGGRET